jgi:hypothetical protein
VYVKVHVAVEPLPLSEQVPPLLRVPPRRGIWDIETVPVGVTAVPLERSVTVTVQVDGALTGSVDGTQTSAVEVVLWLVTVCPSKGIDCE